VATKLFQTHLAFREWQAKRLIAAVKELPVAEFEADRRSSHGGIQGTMQHMYGADVVWLARVQLAAPVKLADIAMPQTTAELEDRWLKVIADWIAFGETISDDGWDRGITYTLWNQTQHTTPLWQLIVHVVNHGTHHAGQVITMLRQAGAKPPQTDLIFYYYGLEA
jgi:uncharacterized damage-inducible protein DinB